MAKASGKTARIFFIAALVAGGMIMANPAQAGFEFKPPPKPQAQSKNADGAPAAPALPAAPVDTARLPDGDMPMQPLPDVPPLPTGQMPGQLPAMQTSVKIAPVPKPAEAAMAPAPSPVMTPPRPPVSAVAAAPLAPAYTLVDGFGSDMPLALALRQIVPANYAYSFDKAVNPGERVNWTGGRPWNDVLNDALAPHGLKATIMANSVRVDPAAGPTPAPQAAGAPAMPSSFAGVKDDKAMSYLTYARKPSEQKDWSGEGTASYPRHEPAKHDGMDQMPAAAPIAPPAPLPLASPISMATPPQAPVVPASSSSAIHTQAPEAIFAESPSAPVPRLPIPESSISRQEDTTYVWPANTDTPAPPPPSMMHPLPPPITSGRPSISRQADTLSSAKQVKADQPILAALPNDGRDTMTAAAPALTPPPAESKQAPVTVASAKLATAPAKILAVPPAAIEPAAGGQSWTAEKGQSLKLVLEDWAQKSGTEFYWNSITDYKLPQDVHASASFTDAVQQVLALYQTEPDRPVGTLQKTQNGASKLVIDSYSAPSSAPEKKSAKAG